MDYPIKGTDVVKAMHGRQWRKDYQEELLQHTAVETRDNNPDLPSYVHLAEPPIIEHRDFWAKPSLKIPGAINWWC